MSEQSITGRIDADIARGDFGLARLRLHSYLSTTGYNPDLLARLGWISYEMHDLSEAGRFWITSSAQGPEIDRAIEEFARRCGHNPHQMITNLPPYARLTQLDHYPPIARTRLRHHKMDEALVARRQMESAHQAKKKWETIIGPILIFAFIFGVISLVVGMLAIGSWVYAFFRGRM